MGTHPTHKNKPNSTPVKMMRISVIQFRKDQGLVVKLDVP